MFERQAGEGMSGGVKKKRPPKLRRGGEKQGEKPAITNRYQKKRPACGINSQNQQEA